MQDLEISALVDELREGLEKADGECREIIVVPPIDHASDDALATIAAALTKEFPQYAWRVTVERMRRGDAFVLIPLRLTPKVHCCAPRQQRFCEMSANSSSRYLHRLQRLH